MKNTFSSLTGVKLAVGLAVVGLGSGSAVHAAPAAPKVKVTAAQATKTATAKFHGKATKPAVLENEDGKWQYAVMVLSGKVLREVAVDANTGKIVDVEVTTEAKETAEEKTEAKEKKDSKPETEADEKDEKAEKGK